MTENKVNKENKKRLLITAVILVAAGAAIFTAAFAILGFDIAKIGTQKYEFNTYTLDEDFNSIEINTETANVIFAESDSDECKIECVEREKMKHSAEVREGTLVIDTENTQKWYDYIGINFGNETVTVYLPKAAYELLKIETDTGSVEIPKIFSFEDICVKVDTGMIGCYADVSNSIELQTDTGSIRAENSTPDGEVKVKTDTGSISIADIHCNRLSAESNTGSIDLTNTIADDNMTINSATGSVRLDSCYANEIKAKTNTGSIRVENSTPDGEVKIKTSTGSIKIADIHCNKLSAESNAGSIDLTNTIADDNMTINSDTGSVRLDGCDANEIKAKTNTGSIIGTLLSDKIFFAKSSVGNVDVPKTTSGGTCELVTSTGSIKIEIKK